MKTIERELVQKTMVFLDKDDIQLEKINPKPYVVVSCNAFSHTLFVESVLDELQLHIESKYLYLGYIRYANAIYNLQQDDIEAHLWLALLLDRYGCKADYFQVWFLSNQFIETSQLKQAKWRIRNNLGFFECINFEGREFDIQHHYLHCPEREEINYEYNLLCQFRKKTIYYMRNNGGSFIGGSPSQSKGLPLS